MLFVDALAGENPTAWIILKGSCVRAQGFREVYILVFRGHSGSALLAAEYTIHDNLELGKRISLRFDSIAEILDRGGRRNQRAKRLRL